MRCWLDSVFGQCIRAFTMLLSVQTTLIQEQVSCHQYQTPAVATAHTQAVEPIMIFFRIFKLTVTDILEFKDINGRARKSGNLRVKFVTIALTINICRERTLLPVMPMG